MLADLAALPATGSPLAVSYPEGQTTALPLLSSALATDDAQASAALAQPAVPAGNGALESARELYSREVLADTLNYLDTRILAVLGASPTLGQRTRAWFSDQVERAAAAAGGFLDQMRDAVDSDGRALGVVLTRMVAFLFTAIVKVLIEVNLFVLVLAMPFWLLPATEEAFYGVLRSLATLAVAVPAYQFVMLLVDALMALVLKYLLFAPRPRGRRHPAGHRRRRLCRDRRRRRGGVRRGNHRPRDLLLPRHLPLPRRLRRVQDPEARRGLSQGRGRRRGLSSTFATGLIAGASTALATAAVGGGGIAGGLLGGGGFRKEAGCPLPLPLPRWRVSRGNGRKPGGLSPANRPGHVVLSPAPAVRSRPAPPIQRGLERDGPVRIAHVHREPRGHLARRRFRDRPQGLGAAAKAKRERRGRPPEGRRESGKGVSQAEPGQDFENLTGLANGTLAEV